MTDTTISVPEELADELYDRKARGESYADVIRRLIDKAEASEPENAGTPTDPPNEAAAAPDTGREAPRGSANKSDLSELIDAVADDVLPGSGAKLEDRREALRAAVEYLREHGNAKPADFQADVYPDHTGRYSDGDDPARSWWKNCIYKGLRALAERSDLVEKADTTGEWSWRGRRDHDGQDRQGGHDNTAAGGE